MEVNKAIFGNRTIDQIPVPSSRVRMDTRTGKKEIHFFTQAEFEHYFATGDLVVGDDAEWILIEQLKEEVQDADK